jgi:ribosome biogenesis SPOUT family RNA methylase Rps3
MATGTFKAADGRTLVTIDGQLRTVQEIYEMAAFEEHKYDEGSSFVPDNRSE